MAFESGFNGVDNVRVSDIVLRLGINGESCLGLPQSPESLGSDHISPSAPNMGSLLLAIPQARTCGRQERFNDQGSGHFLTREEIQEIKTTWNRWAEYSSNISNVL